MATAQSAPTPISLFLRLVDRSVTGTLKVKFDFSFDNQHEKQDSSYILAVKPNVFSSPSTSWGIHEHISDLLLSKEGTDVTFKVGGEEFAAHRCVLAARSAVFKAELFGPTKDGKMESVIQIKDMESKVFRALPSFIYTDLLPEMEMNTMQEGKAQETLWLQHLLAAADRYDLQRLKALCFFLEKEDDPRPLHLGDAYGHFINYFHKILQSHTTARLKLPSKQQLSLHLSN
uniref:Speckle-type POZ protein-like protein B n=1 Tax=Aegilops tauschii TaxID=37682 RepID=M8C3T0_AEGTA